MPRVLKVFLESVSLFFCRKCSHFQHRTGFVLLVLIAVLDAKELSAAGERIRHSLDLMEVLLNLN